MAVTLVNEKTNEAVLIQDSEFGEKKTVSITDYVRTEFATFSEKPLSVVDSLVLSQLCYMNMTGVVPSLTDDARPVTIQQLYRAEYFEQYIKGIFMPNQTKKLLEKLCCSPRYRDVKVNWFVKTDDLDQEKQFSAVTFMLPNGENYVAFRGTDDSINGWKEDFNMFFMDTIPGQISAINYLRIVAWKTQGPIYIGGHSKGGNLSLYAGSFAPDEVQERIITVFNHDGPGLSKGLLTKDGYTDVTHKVNTTLPHESVVGLLFSDGNYNVVASRRVGLLQHDTFAWEIHDGEFIYEKKVKPGSNKLVDSMHRLMDSFDVEERELFVETVFEIIYSAGATTLGEFPSMVMANRDKISRTMKNLPPETQENLKSVMGELVRIVAGKTFALPEKEAEKLNETLAKITETTDKISRRFTDTAEKITRTKDRLMSESAAKINDTTDRINRRKDKLVADSTALVNDTTEKINRAVTDTAEKITRKKDKLKADSTAIINDTADKINRTKDKLAERFTAGSAKLGEKAGKLQNLFGKKAETAETAETVDTIETIRPVEETEI